MTWKLPVPQIPDLPVELQPLQHVLVQLRSMLLLLHEKSVELGCGLERNTSGQLSVKISGDLSCSTANGLAVVDSAVDHGSIGGLADDDHPGTLITVPVTDARNEIVPTTDRNQLTMTGVLGQTKDFLRVRDSALSLMAGIRSNGVVYGKGVDSSSQKVLGVLAGTASTDGANIGQVPLRAPTTTAQNEIRPADDLVPLTLIGATPVHTVDMLQVKDTVLAVVAYITSTGKVFGAGLDARNAKLTSLLAGTADTDGANVGQVVLETLLDAKGDLIVATAADTAARMAVGATDFQQIAVKASATPGIRWNDPLIPVVILYTNTSALAVGSRVNGIINTAQNDCAYVVPTGFTLAILAGYGAFKTGATVGTNYDAKVQINNVTGAGTLTDLATSNNNANDAVVQVVATGTLAATLVTYSAGARLKVGLENVAGSTGAWANQAHSAGCFGVLLPTT